MSFADNIRKIKKGLPPDGKVTLVAVSKTHPAEKVIEAYHSGQLDFGENKVQELTSKFENCPLDIRWHFIGHLQTNKVKYIAPFVHLIQSADSTRLLKEINKQAQNNNRIISCLLQVHIAKEETKFGFDEGEVIELIKSGMLNQFSNVRITGLMGMATNTDNEKQIRGEFQELKRLFTRLKQDYKPEFTTLSMGMSGDYQIAIEEGSTMIRVGSAIFGNREYAVEA
jgi:pyridoxal phosphate enzyme (YggS family)